MCVVILKYSQSMENGAPSAHIPYGVHSLNSWWIQHECEKKKHNFSVLLST